MPERAAAARPGEPIGTAAAAPPAPRVSVVIPAGAGEDVSRAVHVLRLQSLTSWEALIAGGPCAAETHRLIASDARFAMVPVAEDATWAGAVSAGLDRARGTFVTVLDPRDYLMPAALETLVTAALESGEAGAYGGYRFSSPLGVLPGDPLTGATHASGPSAASLQPPERLGLHDLAHCKLLPLHAQIIRRDAVGPARPAFPPHLGGDHAWLCTIALAGRGPGAAPVRWAYAGGPLAGVAMDHPRAPVEIARRLSAHARVIDAALSAAARAAGRDASAIRTATLTPFAQALLLLRAFEKRLAQSGPLPPAERETALARDVEFGNLFAQWWQRLRFLGRPPVHAIAASAPCGTSLAGPDELATLLVDEASTRPGSAPIVLLGLGRNARAVARVLHARGVPVVGRDDALASPPGWAAEDHVPVRLLRPHDPWDERATYLMTVADDAAFLSRLPPGLTVLRWSKMPQRAMAEAVRRVLPELLGEGDMGAVGSAAGDAPPCSPALSTPAPAPAPVGAAP